MNASVGGFGANSGSAVHCPPARRSFFDQSDENATSDPVNAANEAERLDFNSLFSISAGCAVRVEGEDDERRCVLGELSIVQYTSTGQCCIKLVENGSRKTKMHQVLASPVTYMIGSDSNLAWIGIDNVNSSGTTTTTTNKKATVNVFVKGVRAAEDACNFKEKAEEVFFNEPARSTAEGGVEDAETEVIDISLSPHCMCVWHVML